MLDEIQNLALNLSSYVVAAEGNISARDSNGFLIKSSGTKLSDVTKSNCAICDFNGNVLNNLVPSMEYTFHAWIYKNFPNINFIAHTHPTHTLKILCSDLTEEFSDIRLFPDQIVYNSSKSCVVDYFMPGRPLKDGIKKAVKDFVSEKNFFPNLILLKNHGIICAGETATQCEYATHICEKSAEIFFATVNIKRNYLNRMNIEEIINDKNEKYRKTLCQK